jgi:hypothetical protein
MIYLWRQHLIASSKSASTASSTRRMVDTPGGRRVIATGSKTATARHQPNLHSGIQRRPERADRVVRVLRAAECAVPDTDRVVRVTFEEAPTLHCDDGRPPLELPPLQTIPLD